jgi:protein dithiol oxidoreductase (disulfide-forming)
MRFLKFALAALSLSFIAASAGAVATDPAQGVEYDVLPQAQPTDAGKKVEVIEFFWYSCPHCNAFEPSLAEWVKKQGDNIVFKRVPVAFRSSFAPQQRLYYTLEAMGKLDDMHRKVFHAIHNEKVALDTDSQITDFVVKQGIDKQKFTDLYNSFGVQTKVRRAAQLQESYHIDGVPTVIVDGRFVTSPGSAGRGMKGDHAESALNAAALQVMDWLVARAIREHKTAANTAVPLNKQTQVSMNTANKK